MAKKQTFENKLNKQSSNKKNQVIKLIRSNFSTDKGSIRFSEELLKIPDGKSIEAHLKEVLKK